MIQLTRLEFILLLTVYGIVSMGIGILCSWGW